MAIGIIRAGPYGHVGPPRGTQPFESAGAADAYPVNCAKADWPDQPWEALWVRSTQLPLDAGIPTTGSIALGGNIEVKRSTAFIIVNFCYQATQEFEINVSGTVGDADRGVSLSTLSSSIFTIEGDTINESEDVGVPSSYDKTYTLPATVFARFRFELRVNTKTVAETGVSPRQEVELSVTVS